MQNHTTAYTKKERKKKREKNMKHGNAIHFQFAQRWKFSNLVGIYTRHGKQRSGSLYF